MKASKLAEYIDEAIKKHGDMDVIVTHDGDGSYQDCDPPTVYSKDSLPPADESPDGEPLTAKVLSFMWNF